MHQGSDTFHRFGTEAFPWNLHPSWTSHKGAVERVTCLVWPQGSAFQSKLFVSSSGKARVIRSHQLGDGQQFFQMTKTLRGFCHTVETSIVNSSTGNQVSVASV